MDCVVGVACGLDVSAPDHDSGKGADELQKAEGVVDDEERDTAGTVGAVVHGFFNHLCSETKGGSGGEEDASKILVGRCRVKLKLIPTSNV